MRQEKIFLGRLMLVLAAPLIAWLFVTGAAFIPTDTVVQATRFGVTCDGTTNNDTALGNAIAYIKTTGGELQLPPGNCIYTTGLVFDGVGGITIRGAGPHTSGYIGTRLTYNGVGVAITRNNSSWITLADFTLTGTVSATGGILDGTGTINDHNVLKNLKVTGFTKTNGYGRKCVNDIRSYAENVYYSGNYNGEVLDGPTCDNGVSINSTWYQNTNYGQYVHNAFVYTNINGEFSYNTNQGIYISSKGPLTPSSQNIQSLHYYSTWLEGNNSGGGNSGEINITSDIAAADTKNITFTGLYAGTTPGPNYYIYADRATGVALINPDFVSWSYIRVTTLCAGCYAMANNLSPSTVDSGMVLYAPGNVNQPLGSANSVAPFTGVNQATYVSANTTPTSVTNFTGAISGMQITVILNDAYTSITPSSKIVTTSGVSITGAGAVARFVYDAANSKWRQY